MKGNVWVSLALISFAYCSFSCCLSKYLFFFLLKRLFRVFFLHLISGLFIFNLVVTYFMVSHHYAFFLLTNIFIFITNFLPLIFSTHTNDYWVQNHLHNQYKRWISIATCFKPQVCGPLSDCYHNHWLDSGFLSRPFFLLQEDVCDPMQPDVKFPSFFDPSANVEHAEAITPHVTTAFQTAVGDKTLIDGPWSLTCYPLCITQQTSRPTDRQTDRPTDIKIHVFCFVLQPVNLDLMADAHMSMNAQTVMAPGPYTGPRDGRFLVF